MDQATFATQMLGMDAAALLEPVDAEDTPQNDPAPVVTDDAEDTPAVDAETPETADSDDDEAEQPEPVALPFEATANDEAVDPATLAAMTLTFKADGKTETLPLTDIVRRAQSEPAAQRQARSATQEAQQAKHTAEQVQQELVHVRDIALRMLDDPDFYVKMAEDRAASNTPEARAERAESQLAATKKEREDAEKRAEFERAVYTFAQNEVAPTLDAIVAANPLVTPEEIQGWFLTDTLQWQRGGVIQPEFYPQLAAYLKTDLANKVAQRQTDRAGVEAKAKAEARKAQMERQKAKNQSAQFAKPPAVAGATPRDGDTPSAKPRTIRDAEKGALNALLGNLGQ